MADTDIGAQLATAYPTEPAQQSTSGASTSGRRPLGATKKNPFGVERPSVEAMQQSDADIAKATAETGENAVARAVNESDRAEAGANELSKQQDELNTLVAMHKAEYQKELERAKPLFDQADKFQFHQYWADKGTADGVLAAISSALLGFGTGQYHNVAAEMAEKEHQREVSELNSIMERAKMQGASLEELRKVHQDAEQALGVMHLGRYKAIMAQYDRMAAQAGIPEAQTQAAMGKAIQQGRAADHMQKVLSTYSTNAAQTVSDRAKAPTKQMP